MTEVSERFKVALADRYRLERELGAGGMATVYLAHDGKHDRKVAIKVLKPELAAVLGADRFLAEIKTTANLQHPHILPLHDSGMVDGTVFYVMPFVEGETVRDRLNREKQLPVADAVRLATEVAAALDYAHRRGVIHRDIKPDNILVHDGSALVADFGIALAATNIGAARMTETGISLGTPHYMSPEQALGEREITARSDIYALGCVLYEMLTGEPPFTGPTAQAILARVLTGEPAPLRAQRRTIPAHVDAAVLQALARLPADRFGGAAEFAAALANPAHAPTAATAPRTRAWPGARLPWLLLAAAVGLIAYDQLRPSDAAPPPVQHFDLVLPDHARWVEDIISRPALSPDGTLLAYNGEDSSGHRRLFLRPMDRREPVPIAGSEDGQYPFISPDSRWLAYRVRDRIVRTPVSGGATETICQASGGAMGAWLESDAVVVTDSTGLRRCTVAGEMTTLVTAAAGETISFPHSLPGDRGVLVAIERGSVNRLAVLDLRTNQLKSLELSGTDPRYVGSGHLVYAGPDGLVRAVRFDPKRLAVAGQPVIMPEGIRVDFGVAQMALSRAGTMVFEPTSLPQRALELVDRTGRAQRLHPALGDYRDPRFSPDGGRVALTVGDRIWVLDRTQGTLTPMPVDSSASRPSWSRDGERLAYVRQVGRITDLRLVSADGSTAPQSIPGLSALEPWEVQLGPDPRSAVVRTVDRSGSRDVWLVGLDGTRPPVPLLRDPANEVAPAVSPDGRWLAYVSSESGRPEVYVRSFPSMSGRVAVSLEGGTEPVWSPRGGELFYRTGRTLMVAAVQAGATFTILRRAALFTDLGYEVDLTHQAYDVAPSGSQFVMVRNAAPTSRLAVALHVFQHLSDGTAARERGLARSQ